MSKSTEDFVSRLNAVMLSYERNIRSLLEDFTPGDDDAFVRILKACPSIDISHRFLADMADVTPQTIKRWMEGSKAGRYDQRGLVDDIKVVLDQRISDYEITRSSPETEDT